MAELFVARDDGGQLVVIKRILPYLSQEAEFVQMFLDEARIAAQLHHEHIIQVYELGKLEESIFIAMEFLEGIDLRKILQEEQKGKPEGALPYPVAAYILAAICEGLHYAHNRLGRDGKPMGIIHRDVSPQNVMVGYDGSVKLVDFGIAKAAALVERSKPGVIKGKFLYLSPEQLSQDRIDHRADLFALGTMLYEVTTGKSPFHKPTTEGVIYAIRSEDPAPPHLIVPDFPLTLSNIVTKCLTKDRSLRYQQASEIQHDLENFLREEAPFDRAALVEYVSETFGDEDERTAMYIPQTARLTQTTHDDEASDSGALAQPEPTRSGKGLRDSEDTEDPTLSVSAASASEGRITAALESPGVLHGTTYTYELADGPETLPVNPKDIEQMLPRSSTLELPNAPSIGPEPRTRPSRPSNMDDSEDTGLGDEELSDGGSSSLAPLTDSDEGSTSTLSPMRSPLVIGALAFGAVILVGMGIVALLWRTQILRRDPPPLNPPMGEVVPLPEPTPSTDPDVEPEPAGSIDAGLRAAVEPDPPQPEPARPPDPEPVKPPPEPEPRVKRVSVIFRAPKGTRVFLNLGADKPRTMSPGEEVMLLPGSYSTQYQCPPVKKGRKSTTINHKLRVKASPPGGRQLERLSCLSR
jgi:serine/threonine protein kinase